MLDDEPLRRNVSQPGSSLLDEAELLPATAERSSRSLRDLLQDDVLDELSTGGRLADGGGEPAGRVEDDDAYGGRPDDERLSLVEATGYDRELW